MNKIKYFALDFDGTILNSEHKLPTELSVKLKELQEKRYQLVLATGRSMAGVLEFGEELGIDEHCGYIICYNGAEIWEFNKGELNRVYKTQFTLDETRRIVDTVIDDVHTIVTYTDALVCANKINDYVRRGARLLNKGISTDLYHETPKVLIYEDPARKDEVDKIVKGKLQGMELNQFSSAPHAIEITPLSATKGNAINFLCSNYPIKIEEIICFGDSENDISMFEVCKHSVAMGNGINELKELSSHSTLSNDENGVYEFLMKEGFGK